MDDNPYESPLTLGGSGGTMDRPSVARKRLRGTMLLCLYVAAAMWGAMQASRAPHGLVHLLLAAMMASAATGWCVVDSRLRGRPIVQSIHWIMFVTWPLSLPIYLVYSRRLWGLGVAILHGIGLIIICAIAFHLVGYALWGNLWFKALAR